MGYEQSPLPPDPDRTDLDPSVVGWLDTADEMLGFSQSQDVFIAPDVRAVQIILEVEPQEVAREALNRHVQSRDVSQAGTDQGGLLRRLLSERVRPSAETVREINGIVADEADPAEDTAITPEARAAMHVLAVEPKVVGGIVLDALLQRLRAEAYQRFVAWSSPPKGRDKKTFDRLKHFRAERVKRARRTNAEHPLSGREEFNPQKPPQPTEPPAQTGETAEE